MDVTLNSTPPNNFPGMRLVLDVNTNTGLQLSKNTLFSGAPSGTVLGKLSGASSEFALSVITGAYAVNANNELVTTGVVGAAGVDTVRVQALRASPYMRIRKDFALAILPAIEVVIAPTLSALSLNDLTWSTTDAAGATLATISGRTPGSTITPFPDLGQVIVVGNEVRKGLVDFTSGPMSFSLVETLAGATNSGLATPFNATITAPIVLNALTISSLAWSTTAATGAVLATISGKTPGSTITVSPNDGRITVVGNEVRRGSSAIAAGSFVFSLVETLSGATNDGRSTGFTANVSSPFVPGALPDASPSVLWNGTAGTGWAAGAEPVASTYRLDTDPARTMIAPFQADMKAFNGDMELHVISSAWNVVTDFLDGVASVDWLGEGSTVNIPAESPKTFVGADGVSRVAWTWGLKLKHGDFSQDGWIKYYWRANPADPSLNPRIIGPFYAKRVTRANWWDVEYTYGPGGTYATLNLAMTQAKTNWANGTYDHIRLRSVGAHKFNVQNGAGSGTSTSFDKKGIIQIYCDAANQMEMYSAANTDISGWTNWRSSVSGLEFVNIKLDIENIFQIMGETAQRHHRYYNCEFYASVNGSNGLPGGGGAGSKTPRNNGAIPGLSYLFECNWHDNTAGPGGQLVRWSRFDNLNNDLFSKSQTAFLPWFLVYGNKGKDNSPTFMRTPLAGIRVSATGYTTATLRIVTEYTLTVSGGAGVFTVGETVTASGNGGTATGTVRSFVAGTLVLEGNINSNTFKTGVTATGGTSGATCSITAVSTIGKQLIMTLNGTDTAPLTPSGTAGASTYTMAGFASAIVAAAAALGISGGVVTATVLDNNRQAAAIGMFEGTYAAADILGSAFRNLSAAYDIHMDWLQLTSGSSSMENWQIIGNSFCNGEYQTEFLQKHLRDALFMNNEWGNAPNSYTSQINGNPSHHLNLHNTWVNQGVIFYSGPIGSRVIWRGNAMLAASWGVTASNLQIFKDNHVFTGGAPGGTGTTGTTTGSTAAANFVDATNGDFSLIPGSPLATGLVPRAVPYDMLGVARDAMTHKGARN